MLRIKPRPVPRTDVRLKAKRPPMAYIDLLSAAETDFRKTVAEIESDPLFAELHALGVVKRRGGRGPMPTGKYEERLDAHVADFVRRYKLDNRPDALERIQEALRRQGVAAVARRLGAPVAEVRRLARFLEPQAEPQDAEPRRAASEGPKPDLDDFVAAPPSVDISEATETVRDFVQRQSLTQHQLVADFLHAEDPPALLARRYRTTEDVIRRVMEAVNFVLTADAAAPPPPAAGVARTRRGEDSVPIVARVFLRDGEPQLHFGEDTGYGLRYVIDPGALAGLSSGEERERGEEMVALLRHINQRRSVQCQVVAVVFEKQKAYFASGDELDLVPLGQADIARDLKEHQSTVSRAVRGRYLDTPYGTHELQFYCQRKRDVILRLSAAHPEASDRQLQDLLAERYGCRIARRTVAYHRSAHRR
jgi:hypothetical protein